jgi:hypothetical protein
MGGTPARPATVEDEGRGTGWILFSGTMITILGILNVIYGIGAIDNSQFYVQNVQYILGDLNTWGWILVVVGAVQVLAGLMIFARNAFGRWVGVAAASVNMIVQLLFITSQPLASVTLFAVDVLVIYGLLAYGGRSAARA